MAGVGRDRGLFLWEPLLQLRFQRSFVLLLMSVLLPVLLPDPPPVLLSGAKDLAVLPDGRCRCLKGFLQALLFQLAFPDDDDGPALGLQLAPGVLVALPVAGYLGGPEVGVGLGDRVILAIHVAVPEATVDEDDGAVLGEDDVRRAWETFVVDSVAEAFSPQGTAQRYLRLRRGGADM